MELGSIPRRVRRADATVTNFDRVDVRTVGDYTPAAGEAVPAVRAGRGSMARNPSHFPEFA